MSLVRRHPLITFFVLTYALAWILWLPLVVLQDTIPAAPGLVLVLLGSNVPSLLAIVLTPRPAPDLARRSPLVPSGSARTCRPRRGHGWPSMPSWEALPLVSMCPYLPL
jgi:hypothetical protein